MFEVVVLEGVRDHKLCGPIGGKMLRVVVEVVSRRIASKTYDHCFSVDPSNVKI